MRTAGGQERSDADIGDIGEILDAAAGVRIATRRAGPLSAARCVADLDRTPWYALRSARAGSAEIGSGAAPSEFPNGLSDGSHG
jgi:hypothetical protein